MSVLIDTSAWIEYFRNTDSPANEATRQQIEAIEPFVNCGPVTMEVTAGARNDDVFDVITSVLMRGVTVAIRPHYFDNASALYRECRSSGITIRSMIDCLVAVVALDNDLELLHHDRDFDAIASVAPLRVHPASLS